MPRVYQKGKSTFINFLNAAVGRFSYDWVLEATECLKTEKQNWQRKRGNLLILKKWNVSRNMNFASFTIKNVENGQNKTQRFSSYFNHFWLIWWLNRNWYTGRFQKKTHNCSVVVDYYCGDKKKREPWFLNEYPYLPMGGVLLNALSMNGRLCRYEGSKKIDFGVGFTPLSAHTQ